MMEKVGVLVVSYGAREAAIIDLLVRSQDYKVEIYVADKQRNPFNVKNAAKHVVIPDLSIKEICKFAEANKSKLNFGIVGPEKPIIEGVRDLVEKRAGLPMICPTREYAMEGSKVQQRLLFERIVPEANPRFKVFNPREYRSIEEVRRAVYSWLEELGDLAVVKPDRPAAGKGVGVWGDHFTTREQLFEHFLSNYQHGSVLIEEKIDGEESSFQALCDGNHLVPLPETRDYKRAFDGDKGPNTGGMGSYKSAGEVLPFMIDAERRKETEIVTKVFSRMKSKAGSSMRGVPFYMAFMHTGMGPKILENNSRPGDPEIINILPIIKEDFVDICFKILEGNLTQVRFERKATVLTYKVPPDYGGYAAVFPNLVNENEVDTPVNLAQVNRLAKGYRDAIRVYPASMEQRGSEIWALKSRAVGVLGISDDIETARQVSLEGIRAINGGALWNRTDIASSQHIERSVEHMQVLRGAK
jgi:phosphoribosylamine--glycine ligase